MPIRSINPATNEKLEEFEPMTREATLDALENAHRAFSHWRKTSFDHRGKILLKAAATLRDRPDEFAELITLEMGKRIQESHEEITFCAQILEFYANGAERFLADETMEIDDADAYIQYAPLGALLGVMPWNFPFYQVIRFAAPNLMAGNTVLVKHASCVPQCAERIAALFSESGLPEGYFTNLLIPSEFVAVLIADKRIAGVSLTGSEAAGAAVAAEAGKNIKRSVLELGGNDAFIVLEDADMEHTVEMAVRGRMGNTGQSCVASKRFIVVEKVAARFLKGLKRAMSKLKMGDPMDPDTGVGPLSTEEAAVDLLDKVQKAIDAGASVVLGGGRRLLRRLA